MRLLCERIEKARRDGPSLSWWPRQRIPRENFVDVLALALSVGPGAALEFADLIGEDMALRVQAIVEFFMFQDAEAADRLTSAYDRQLCAGILSVLGLAPYFVVGSFFSFLDADSYDPRSSASRALDWFLAEGDEAILQAEAHRAGRYGVHAASRMAAAHFLNPSLFDVTHSVDGAGVVMAVIYTHRSASPEQDRIGVAAPADAAISTPSVFVETPKPAIAPRKPVWAPPTPPEGVEIADRALRELRKERDFPEERFADALELLGLYRAMRLGALGDDDYQIACRERRFTDSRCFADAGSFGAFRNDYTVRHAGASHLLTRHLKWGKSNNARAALRVYYAWDEDRRVVVVGSAPRHLPIWMS